MKDIINYDALETELMAKGARSRDFATGRVAGYSGEPIVIRFIDDGYRIYATWVSGGPISPKPGECIQVAEYKHCDIPTLAEVFTEALMLYSDPRTSMDSDVNPLAVSPPTEPGSLGPESVSTASSPIARCSCDDRLKSECPGEWEQGCDLGNNPRFIRAHLQTPKEMDAMDAALGFVQLPPIRISIRAHALITTISRKTGRTIQSVVRDVLEPGDTQ